MGIPNRQIGWSTKSNLLWQISKQLERLTQVASNIQCPTCPTSPFWSFVADADLQWPANQDGYTLYDGGWSSYDDGQTNTPTPFGGEFASGGSVDTEFILSTNGFLYGDVSGMYIYGNQSDLFLTPGDPLDDGDIQNFWYANTGDSSKWKTSILVYCGHCCGSPDQETPWSYIVNIYKDGLYQYIETKCKDNLGSNSGPDGDTQSASNLSQVWQSPLDGSTWTYLGFGSIQ